MIGGHKRVTRERLLPIKYGNLHSEPYGGRLPGGTFSDRGAPPGTLQYGDAPMLRNVTRKEGLRN